MVSCSSDAFGNFFQQTWYSVNLIPYPNSPPSFSRSRDTFLPNFLWIESMYFLLHLRWLLGQSFLDQSSLLWCLCSSHISSKNGFDESYNVESENFENPHLLKDKPRLVFFFWKEHFFMRMRWKSAVRPLTKLAPYAIILWHIKRQWRKRVRNTVRHSESRRSVRDGMDLFRKYIPEPRFRRIP